MTQELRKTVIFFLLFAGVAALIWGAVFRPIQTWNIREMAGLTAAQDRSIILVERIEQLRREKETLSAATRFDGVWTAANMGEATARVQATLSEIARNNGMALRAITPLRSEPSPLKEIVSFRIEAEATLDQLATFLRAAEFHRPVLLFEKGTIRRLARPGPQSPQPLVFFQFDISAPFDLRGGE